MADISADIRDEISDISALMLLIWIIIMIFCLRDCFILFYVCYGISMMFLYDVWIINYFFNNVLYVFTIDISTGI